MASYPVLGTCQLRSVPTTFCVTLLCQNNTEQNILERCILDRAGPQERCQTTRNSPSLPVSTQEEEKSCLSWSRVNPSRTSPPVGVNLETEVFTQMTGKKIMCFCHIKTNLFSLSITCLHDGLGTSGTNCSSSFFASACQQHKGSRTISLSPPTSLVNHLYELITSSHLQFCDAPWKDRSWFDGLFHSMFMKTLLQRKGCTCK